MKKPSESAPRLVIAVSAELHRDVVIAAAKEGMGYAEWVRGLIEKALRKAA